MSPAPGAWNCCHSGLSVEESPLDLEHEEISDVQLQVNTVLCGYPSLIKHIFPSWSVECMLKAGAGGPP